MTATTTRSSDRHPADRTGGISGRAGGIAGLAAAATFVVGIVMFATMLTDYTMGDPTPAESAAFVVAHQTPLFLWYLVTFIVFGAVVVPLALALHDRLRDGAPGLARAGTVFGLVWVGLVLATGMVANVGIGAVADLAATDPTQAASLWSAVDTVTNGLGGGNEVVGGLWVLLVSLAALRTGAFPRPLGVLGVVSAGTGLATVAPGLEGLGLVFGLGLIVWFAWVGAELLRSPRP